MNSVELLGRLTKKPELAVNQNGKSYCRFTLAINRPKRPDEDKADADFISCVAWNETAELINKYVDKGDQLVLEGRLQTGSYETENGEKRYTTDVLVRRIHFVANKKDNRPEPEEPYESTSMNDVYSDFGESISVDDNFLD